MTCKLTGLTKENFLNQLLETISIIDLKKGKLVRVDCDNYIIEYELPENYCVGTKDWGGLWEILIQANAKYAEKKQI